MDRREKVELFEQIRREYRYGAGTIKGVAEKLGVHRRTVRQALASAVPPERKPPERRQPKLDPVRGFIDEILEADQQAPRKQRHTAIGSGSGSGRGADGVRLIHPIFLSRARMHDAARMPRRKGSSLPAFPCHITQRGVKPLRSVFVRRGPRDVPRACSAGILENSGTGGTFRTFCAFSFRLHRERPLYARIPPHSFPRIPPHSRT